MFQNFTFRTFIAIVVSYNLQNRKQMLNIVRNVMD